MRRLEVEYAKHRRNLRLVLRHFMADNIVPQGTLHFDGK